MIHSLSLGFAGGDMLAGVLGPGTCQAACDNLPTAATLRSVQGGIGCCHELGAKPATSAYEGLGGGHPGAQCDRGQIRGDGPVDPEHPRGDLKGLRLGTSGQEHRDLVASKSRERIVPAGQSLQLRGDGLQDRIAGGVAVAVIEGLEAVDVEKHERDRNAGTVRLRETALERVVPPASVEQPGERIVGGLLGEPGVLATELPVLVPERAEDADRDEQERAPHQPSSP